ncbi:MAG: hypothetical protein ACPGNV_01370 [Mangrovicoccus sp.]
MSRFFFCLLASLAPMMVVAQPAAQSPYFATADLLVAYQGNTDLDTGGEFSSRRFSTSVAGHRGFGPRSSIGVELSLGGFEYNFTDSQGFGSDITVGSYGVSVPLRFGLAGGQALLIPNMSFTGEDGVSFEDGSSYGVIGALSWKLADNLIIGPGFGVYSTLADEWETFPFLVIDWDITERWNLSTSEGVGATQGPGLSISYGVSDALRLGVASRVEAIEFRLNDDGPGTDGIGKDQYIPVVATVNYEPSANLRISAFAGAQFDGQLKLEDADGNTVSRSDYDSSPIIGAVFKIKF